jgi:hypothetical protein
MNVTVKQPFNLGGNMNMNINNELNEARELDLDLEIEVLDGREELLVAAAGTTCSNHVRPQPIVIQPIVVSTDAIG